MELEILIENVWILVWVYCFVGIMWGLDICCGNGCWSIYCLLFDCMGCVGFCIIECIFFDFVWCGCDLRLKSGWSICECWIRSLCSILYFKIVFVSSRSSFSIGFSCSGFV